MSPKITLPFVWFLLATGAFCGETSDGLQPNGAGLRPFTSVATQNAGTSQWLDILAYSPMRDVCHEWYENNLCTIQSEEALAAVIQTTLPDILLLQEMWNQSLCDEDDRPAEVDSEPYACSQGSGSQIERILPADYSYGCADGYPDNCIAFREDVFTPQSIEEDSSFCDARDCSPMMVSNPSECGPDGRLAYIKGQSAYGPTVLVAVHASAGPESQDSECRAEQLAAMQQVLEQEPPETVIVMAGDFNFDPTREYGVDVDTLALLQASLGLERLEDDGYTHLLLYRDLDLVLVRGWPDTASIVCTISSANEGEEVPMFDHGFVFCGTRDG